MKDDCAANLTVPAEEIDFKAIVDHLDNSILITDGQGKVLYVNSAYVNGSGILPKEVVGRYISDIIADGKLFKRSVTDIALRKKQVVTTLSASLKKKPEIPVIATGIPVFDQQGSIRYGIASSRPIASFSLLKDEFVTFIDALKQISDTGHQPRTVNSASDLCKTKVIGKSPEIESILSLIDNIAPTKATVLISGESGTGKEVIADTIYERSDRADKPFVKINCASIPPNLLESELFGYEKGAFSGANSMGKPGFFELANGGTLLLDEIGEMSMDLQSKLLRILESLQVTRVGGTRPIPLNVRIIASTNADLSKKIRQGSFRSDLYYRLRVVPIHVPPLRERKQDISLFVDHYISFFSQKYQRPFLLSKQQLSILCEHPWPGNIRELRNLIEYLVLCFSATKTVDDMALRELLGASNDLSTSNLPGFLKKRSLNELLSVYEKDILQSALKNAETLKDVSEVLGIDLSTVYRKIKQYDLSFKNRSTFSDE